MQSITIKTIDNSQADAAVLGTIDLNGITTSGFAPETIADIALVALATGEWECQFAVELHGFPEGDEKVPSALVFIHDAQQCDSPEAFFDWHAREADSNGVVDLTGGGQEDMTLIAALAAGEIIVARSELHYIVDDGGSTLRVASGAEFLSAYDEEYEAYCESQFGEEDGAW